MIRSSWSGWPSYLQPFPGPRELDLGKGEEDNKSHAVSGLVGGCLAICQQSTHWGSWRPLWALLKREVWLEASAEWVGTKPTFSCWPG